MTDDDIIAGIIEREGGYVDHPLDKGGPTKFGVTLAALSRYRMTSVSAEDVKQLSVTEAKALYRQDYIVRPGFDLIEDERLRSLVIDAGVNHGTEAATRMLQKAVGVAVDGVFGLNTANAVKKASPTKLWLCMMGERLSFYGRIITNKPDQAVFAHGWMNRMNGLLRDFAGPLA